MTAPRAWAWPDRPAEQLEQRIVIAPDNTIIARSGKVEYGQGIRTGFAAIVAEELAVPIESVRMSLGDTDEAPWDMGTFGSMSTATDGARLRAAAVKTRSILLERAAARFGVGSDTLTLREARVTAPDGRTLTYAELTVGDPVTGVVPSAPVNPRRYEPLVAPRHRLEANDIVRGLARYAADVRLPSMLFGHVLHPPVVGARLASLDDSRARSMPGVVAVVRESNFAGIVAERQSQAVAAVGALTTIWEPPDESPDGEITSTLRKDGDVSAALDGAARVVEAAYSLPPIAHASIGPSAAVADVGDAGAHLYVATQRPFALRDEVARMLDCSTETVHVHPQAMSGLYGRGNVSDAAIEAVRLSRVVRRPVMVQWSRREEFQSSPCRPQLDARVRAGLDASGRIVAWDYAATTNPHTYGGPSGNAQMAAMTSGRNAVPPYDLGTASVVVRTVPGALRTGAFRSLAAAPHVFAIESFMDELAQAAGADPIEFRLRHLQDERLRAVLRMVRDASEHANSRRPGFGLGVACAVYNGTPIAQAVEVLVTEPDSVRVTRVWCAVDAGRLVFPDGARNQIEGGVQQAASWTLFEELLHNDGAVTTTGWRDYRIATALDAPLSIEVQFVNAPDRPSTGVGEPGSVPTAAAIANAVFNASGRRIRRLPICPRPLSA